MALGWRGDVSRGLTTAPRLCRFYSALTFQLSRGSNAQLCLENSPTTLGHSTTVPSKLCNKLFAPSGISRQAHCPFALLPPVLLLTTDPEGDIVLVHDKRTSGHDGDLFKLRAWKQLKTKHSGTIEHADMIGKEPRQVVYSSKNIPFRINEPSLADYVRLTPRIVTPVRPLRQTPRRVRV